VSTGLELVYKPRLYGDRYFVILENSNNRDRSERSRNNSNHDRMFLGVS